jgi:putative hemolysin
MALFARVAAPLVWVLDRSSALLLRVIGVRARAKPTVTEEELHLIIHEASRSGVIEEEERALMAGIMRLADRPVREVMTPRTEIDSIDRRATETEIRAAIKASPHSLLPVTDGSPDRIVGVVKVREVLALLLAGKRVQLARIMREAEVVPDQLDAMDALRALQQADVAMALVHDEYGHLEGIVTPADLLAAIVGNFASHQDAGEAPPLTEQSDGSLLVAGALPADALADRLGLELPDTRDYATAAGFALSVLKRLPQAGEAFTAQGWRFEVAEMDGRRIEQLRVLPEPSAED